MDPITKQRLLIGLITGGFFVIVVPFFIWLAVRPKKEKTVVVDLDVDFTTNPKIPIEDDFAEYVKSSAREAEVKKRRPS